MNDNNANNTQNTKNRFCIDCGFKYKEEEMMERRDKKWFCRRCASRNQL